MEPQERKERKAEVQRERETLQREGLTNYALKPLLHYWKTQPLHALGTFLMGALIYYLAFSFLQAVNYDFIYCTSNVPGYTGKQIDVYNAYVQMENKKTDLINHAPPGSLPLDAYGRVMNDNDQINCNYNFTRWRTETDKQHITSVTNNFIKIALKR